MDAVVRLVTYADSGGGDDDDPLVMSVSLRQDAVLADGRRLVLLDDRGWTSRLRFCTDDDASDDGVPDVWSTTSVAEVEADARVVVGPDEPYEGRTQADMELAHWSFLAAQLGRQGIVVEALELRGLPHDVVLSDRLVARIG